MLDLSFIALSWGSGSIIFNSQIVSFMIAMYVKWITNSTLFLQDVTAWFFRQCRDSGKGVGN